MTLHERTGKRDLLYSQWHRPASISRFVTRQEAAQLTVIDIDWCETCALCREPLALIETQRSAGRPKSARITTNLASRAQLPAYSVSYIPTDDGDDIARFLVQQLWAESTTVREFLPAEYARWLVSLRERHECAVPMVEVLYGREPA